MILLSRCLHHTVLTSCRSLMLGAVQSLFNLLDNSQGQEDPPPDERARTGARTHTHTAPQSILCATDLECRTKLVFLSQVHVHQTPYGSSHQHTRTCTHTVARTHLPTQTLSLPFLRPPPPRPPHHHPTPHPLPTPPSLPALLPSALRTVFLFSRLDFCS